MQWSARRWVAAVGILMGLAVIGGCAGEAPTAVSAPTQVADNVVVVIDYTLTDPQGKVLDSSVGQEPLAYVQGHRGIIPGLQKGLVGKKKGDTLKVTVPPDEAYGRRDEKLVMEMPRTAFQGVDEIQPGMRFGSATLGGMVRVTRVDGDKITVDANHELADMTLTFDVTIRDLRAATAEELAHGHVHGPGGAQH